MTVKPFFRSTLIALLLASCLTTARASDEQVTLNFVNSDVESTIKAVGVITGKNFVIDPKVKGTINIVSNQPVARSLIYPILLSALRQQGFTAVENDSIVKVMPDVDAKTQSVQVFNRRGKTAGDKVVTKVFPLTHESATQLANTLRPLVSVNNLIAAYNGANTLVVTDYADNVARISQIIDNIDQPGANDVFPVPVRYASALDVAQSIGRLMPEIFVQGVASPMAVAEGVKRTVIVPDIRNNQLLVRSEAPAHTKQIKSLVASLDTPAASGSNINVVYLRNAEAVALANTLKGILTGQDTGSTTGSGSTGSSNSSSSGLGSTTSGSSTTTGSTATTGSLTTTSSMTSGSTNMSGSAPQSAGASIQFGGATVLLRADSTTNALVITAPDHIYNSLRAVIDKLDVRRAQVYIEALIAEVNITKARELGVQWVAAGGDDSFGAGVISSISPGSASLGSLYSNFAAGTLSIPNTFTLGLFNGDPTSGTASLGMLASALETNGGGNVLSAPNLLMLDNEEARIMVGQNIPILTGSYTTTSGSSTNPFQTVERKDVGIVLKIKPQISDSGTIALKVAQEVSSVDNTVDTDGAGLATKVRQIDTKVLVDDGQTIVLGGLIEERVNESKYKVPLLGDIPYVGALFRYEDLSHEKVNLMVFLRPVILRDAKTTQALSSERYEYLRAEQGRFSTQGYLPSLQLPAQTVATPAVPSVVAPSAVDLRRDARTEGSTK
ncbi:type II secretion system secretin GspD [Propionivibrio limicola]|uniref:type II secretion system secretin GspD n=1 Tax=Propionivibrio limicola TaxID=167645 RepID=UPI00129178CB|nr:type II secretion system secretin GspD [Propionivibrio limicola]